MPINNEPKKLEWNVHEIIKLTKMFAMTGNKNKFKQILNQNTVRGFTKSKMVHFVYKKEMQKIIKM